MDTLKVCNSLPVNREQGRRLVCSTRLNMVHMYSWHACEVHSTKNLYTRSMLGCSGTYNFGNHQFQCLELKASVAEL